MGIVNKIKRALRSYAYRAAVKNTAAAITNGVEALKIVLTSYEVEQAVVDTLDKNKAAIEAIDWKSIETLVSVLKKRLEEHSPLMVAFTEAATANINLVKAEFKAEEEA